MIKLYTAPWCSQCQNLKKTLTGIDVDVIEVDIDTIEGGDDAASVGVRGIPLLLDTETGKMMVGNVSKEKALKFLGK